jgi:hypothetical protein
MMLPLLLSLLLLCGPATASSSSSHSHSSHSHSSHSSLRRLESEVDVYHLSALHPSKQIPYHWFGEALAVQGDVAIVGAPGTEDFSNYGMVYVFHKQRGGESWAEVAALEAPSRGVYASFGAAVSIFQGCAFVGAPKYVECCWDFRAVLCCAVLCCAVLCCAVLCCAVLCCAVLCCVVLCCTVLCCVVLCCTVLCCVVLCCAVLCCAVL